MLRPLSTPSRLFAPGGFLAFAPRHQPPMVRRNYRHELRSAFTFPLAAAMAEGTFAGVVADKYFGANLVLIAVLTAAPMFGNILALVWSNMAQRRPMVAFVNRLQIGVVICIAAVGLTALLPKAADGHPTLLAAWCFAGLIVAARVLASGIVTVRSAIWRFNYPTGTRARIVGRITVIYNAMLGLMTFAGGLLMDWRAWIYAVLYPTLAAVSLIGVRSFGRIRVRGQRNLLRRLPPGRGVVATLRRMAGDLSILRHDKAFAGYQWCQFLLGVSFMFMVPPLIQMVSRDMTDPKSDYTLALIVLHLLPTIVGVVSVQLWAPVFDRLSILRFRVVHGVAVLATHATLLAGALSGQLWLVGCGTALMGLSVGGGQLAWQLGQHAFAPPERSGAYMGVHVMLTGLRGMLAPFAGAGVYLWLNGLFSVGGIAGGRFVFAGSVLVATLGFLGFVRLDRKYGRLPNEGL